MGGLAVELAGQDDLLLVATGEAAGRLVDGGAANVVLLAHLLGKLVDGVGLEPGAVADGEAVGVGLLEHEVLGDGHAADEAHGVAVLGDVAQASVDEGLGAEEGDLALGVVHLAGLGRDEARDHLGELGLAVAVDAGDAHDLSAV